MGYTITAQFRPDARRPAAYWWPLLFEALRRQGMSLDVPRLLPEHLVRYLPTDDASDRDRCHDVPFHELWERLNNTTGRFHDIVSVWHPDIPGWEVVATVGGHQTPWNEPPGQAPTPQDWDRRAEPHMGHPVLDVWTSHLRSDPAGGGVAPESVAVGEYLLALLVALAGELAEICGAGTGELTYERTGVLRRFGAIGKPLELLWWASADQRGTYEAPIARTTLPSGRTLTVVSRLPEDWTPGPLAVRLPAARMLPGVRSAHPS
jgi:hypothetical protein